MVEEGEKWCQWRKEWNKCEVQEGRGRLTIGIVVRVNDAAGGVEVGKPALIRAIKRGGTLLDNESLLRWLKGSRLGGRIFG